MLFSGANNPQNCFFPWDQGPHGSLSQLESTPPNGISIGLAVFPGLNHATPCVAIGRYR